MSVCDHLVAPGVGRTVPRRSSRAGRVRRRSRCPRRNAPASTTRATPAVVIRRGGRVSARIARRRAANRCGTTTSVTISSAVLSRARRPLPVDPMAAFARGGGQGPGLDRYQPRRVHAVRGAAVPAAGQGPMTPETYPQELSATFGRDAGAVAARYPLDRVRRQRAVRVLRGGHGRRVRLRGRRMGRGHGRGPAPSTPTNSTTATRRHRTRCAPALSRRCQPFA